ncbi:MAG: hypothetical protein DRQ39_05970 [Gammaproteobacteria bacterium]|nr:MAG: hypothetical protein DRQ39_05970 [Gammaproteobacteria bacterium]RKZ93726.1 MAG: hypothetical protein DRQ40_07270 [Gammaproteobacteria bacterium]
MKYKVRETYTPDDPDADRARQEAGFESDSTDLVELAFLARRAIWGICSRNLHKISPEGEANIRTTLEYSDIADQLTDQEVSAFDFLIFGNSGEWSTSVEAEG